MPTSVMLYLMSEKSGNSNRNKRMDHQNRKEQEKHFTIYQDINSSTTLKHKLCQPTD